MEILLTPPFALLIYISLVLLLVLVGKKMAGPEHPSEEKSSIYGGGESAPMGSSIPGYRPFILVAFFFALLHLGILVLGTSHLQGTSVYYIVGLILVLIALILG